MRKEQIHGGDIYRNKEVTDFSVNSNPLGLRMSVLQALREHTGNIVHYPDVQCEELTEAISRFEQAAPEEILCGNGAAEIIFAAVFAAKPKRALLLAPSFAEYERALKALGPEIIYHTLRPEEEFLVGESLLDKITPALDMMFLCNPNNPTGQPVERGLLLKILERCLECQVLFVLDECFLDFLSEPWEYEMKDFCRKFSNLLLVKAFTKIFCMPGLRLGYAISSNQALLNRMSECLQPWNVSVPAQTGGIAALQDCETYLEDTRRFVIQERTRLIGELVQLGYTVYGSKANYIFFYGKEGLYEKALEAGFLIRDCQNYPGLKKGYYRIAVRTKAENERMIAWLRQL